MSRSIWSRTRSRVLTLLPVMVLVAGFTLAGTTPAFAVTSIVNCAPGPDDLGLALAAAAPGDTLTIGGTCTGNFVIDKKLTLQGAVGATLDAGGSGRVLGITGSVKVKIADLTITNGDAAGGGIYNGGGTVTLTNSHVDVNVGVGFGGGIYNDGGTLTVTNSTVNGNSTPSGGIGGGIYNNHGTLTITNSHVDGNSAAGALPFGQGGGIYNNHGTLTITNSHVDGNSASADYPSGGGGILNFGGNLTVSSSTLSGNSATGSQALGGGIENRGGGNLTLSNSTLGGVTGNSAIFGGGIGNQSAFMTITGSTFAGNTAIDGGGILNEDGFATITNSTFSGNSATGTVPLFQNGGAIDSGNLNGVAFLSITNSTFAGNTANGPGSDIDLYTYTSNPATASLTGTVLASGGLGNCYIALPPGSFVDNGYNISSDGSCGFSGTSLNNTDPMLGALASNGGPTQTRALAPLSPAVDAIPTCPSVPVDQRGTVRPQGSACDIGAYELKAPWIAEVTVDSGVSGSPASVSGTITCNQGAPFTVSVTLTQGKKKALGTSSAGTCNGSTPVPWTASVSPGTFAPGAAKVSYTATDGTSKKTGKGIPVTLT